MAKQAIFEKKNVLVAGGAGFIGSHLCDELLKNAKVICVDNFSSGSERNIDHLLADPDFIFLNHDIVKPLDLKLFPEFAKFKLEFQGIQEIYNLACPTAPLFFENNKESILLANSYGVKNIMDLAFVYKAKVLHFSSSVVYGLLPDFSHKIKEDEIYCLDQLSPRSAYDEGKRFAESLVWHYRSVNGVDAKIMRLFRTYGPRMPLGAGHMIPDFVDNALKIKDLEIFGDINFASSFCYVDDVIDAALKMMDAELDHPLNIGSDVRINVTSLAQKVLDFTKSKSKIIYKNSLPFMTPLGLPDISRAISELGWMPIVTLENGLKKTILDLMAQSGVKEMKDVL